MKSLKAIAAVLCLFVPTAWAQSPMKEVKTTTEKVLVLPKRTNDANW